MGGLPSDLIQPADSDLTYEQLFAVQPFNNPLVVQELTGDCDPAAVLTAGAVPSRWARAPAARGSCWYG
ncbi:5'-nucleotidase C-terminal domain-containing protein [Pseudomonas sp. JR33AA]|uniref:5'-nucleotidase C-terminal domain-containing protein n=1 Tax=Pseudomonas sp. JR33AA TaxID=2899113 RepID=UPI003FA3AB21